MEIHAGSVLRGDQIMIGGQVFPVLDMVALPGGGKRLVFASGETLTLKPRTTLWAGRRIDARWRLRRWPPLR
ncbi:hypothetical protein [Streptomyces litchfieldiae]|uniref:Uncharacterized protein n=1 Tax=Streptomyces litchfieldiae TaxID=3075543 RepID=A0ABU2MNU2_9ACTN|nr:hypothetical protein [Streptomyces sp. DSM 44938]MDT0343279.1 hypothetical protein [Streptomyces sp. DSM 44938]